MRRRSKSIVALLLAGVGTEAGAQEGPAARLGSIQAVVPAGGYGPADPVYRAQGPTSATATFAAPSPAFSTPMPMPSGNSLGAVTPAPNFPQAGTQTQNVAPTGPVAGAFPFPSVSPGFVAPGAEYAPPGFNGMIPPAAGPRWWVSAEALLWWSKGQDLPPLLTTSSPQFNGVLGTGNTQVLIGGTQSNMFQPGFRVGVGRWLACDHMWAIEASFFYLPTQTQTFGANSTQFPVLARPFFNLNQNIPFSEVVASPGLSTGGLNAQLDSSLWGGDINARRYLYGDACRRLDVLGGFRYLSLDEQLTLTEVVARTPNSNTGIGVPSAVSAVVTDSFQTQNKFYGWQFGLDWESRVGRFFYGMKGKLAFGAMNSTVNVAGGQQVTFNNGITQSYLGGLLALPGNIGTYTETKFAWVPELGLTAGYHITPRLRFSIGYNVLYVSHVLRPGDQIDQGIDVTRIPNFPVPGVTPLPGTRPAQTFKSTDYWAQGINLGLQYTW